MIELVSSVPSDATRRTTGPTDPVNGAISWTLLGGSLASAALLAVGLATWLVAGAPPAAPRTLPQWIDRLVALDPAAVVFIGIIAVTLTPVAQLLAAFAAFAQQREWRYAGVALSVLAIVVGSAVIAILVSQGG